MRAVAGIWMNGMIPGTLQDVDEDEHRQEERRPTKTRTSHRLHDDVLLDELDGDLGEVARTLRRGLVITIRGDQEQHGSNQRGSDRDEHDLVDARRDVLPAQQRVDRWEVKATGALPLRRLHEYGVHPCGGHLCELR